MRWACAIAAIVALPLAAHTQAAAPRLGGVRVPFEANRGGFDPGVAFAAHTFAGAEFVTRDGKLVHALAGKARDPGAHGRRARGPGWTLVETLVGASPLTPAAAAPNATAVNRFVGSDPAHWQHGTGFDGVRLGEAWPGVDVALAARGDNVEKLFTLAPGADAGRIRVRVDGARGLRIENGALLAHTGNGDVAFTAPVAWQTVDGVRRDVAVSYRLLAQDRYGFALGAHEARAPVTIDPLLQSTYVGGSGYDAINAMAIDAGGNVYVAGTTSSTAFPGTAGGAQSTFAGAPADAFVAKFNAALTTLVAATYLGGSKDDEGAAVALDASGNVFVAGLARDVDFPGTSGGAIVTNATTAGTDCFVAELSNGLDTLMQSTYFGGSDDDTYCSAIGIDSGNAIYVTGWTGASNLPGTSGSAQPALAGDGFANAFVAKFANNLKTLTKATYLGGATQEALGYALAIDGGDRIFVTGETRATDFPGTSGGAFPAAPAGAFMSAFVARFNGTLTSLQSTYLGGSFLQQGNAIALDSSGNVYVTGYTRSTDFPGTTGGAQSAHDANASATDAFVAKFDNGLSGLQQATYFGGNGDDYGSAIAVDASGNVYLGGTTELSTNLPGTSGGIQPAHPDADTSGFVARFNGALTTLTQSTYFSGASGDNELNALKTTGSNVYVGGLTSASSFQGMAGGAQSTYGGGDDGFVARMTSDLTASSGPFLSIDNVSGNEGNGGTTPFAFTVTLSPASAQTVTVDYATADGTATVADNDYQAASGTLTFNPGETTKTVVVSVVGDTKVEPDETFFVNLSGATQTAPVPAVAPRRGSAAASVRPAAAPAAVTLLAAQGIGTIVNDDAPPPPPQRPAVSAPTLGAWMLALLGALVAAIAARARRAG